MKCFFLGLILVGCLPLLGMAATHSVCSTCAFHSPEQALAAAQAYDTIAIQAGTYRTENVVIKKPLTLIGFDDPVWYSKSGDEIITVLSDSVSIQGLTLRDVTTSYLKERSAIRVKQRMHFLISNNQKSFSL